jgi:hypothetical protein
MYLYDHEEKHADEKFFKPLLLPPKTKYTTI